MITPALLSRSALLRIRQCWDDGVGRGARLRTVATQPGSASWADVEDLLAHQGVSLPHLSGVTERLAGLSSPVTPGAVWCWIEAHDGIALLELLDADHDDAELARRLRGPVVSRLVGRTA